MRRIGNPPRALLPWATCLCRGRLFYFSQKEGKLRVGEALLGEKPTFTEVEAGVACRTIRDARIACCALEDRILVVAVGKKVFAALVDVDDAALSAKAVHITTLTPLGLQKLPSSLEVPVSLYLCPARRNQAVLSFGQSWPARHCKVNGGNLLSRELGFEKPPGPGLDSLPIQLPDGRLLVAGGAYESGAILAVSLDGGLQAERVGTTPGRFGPCPSLVLAKKRFVLGFGGRRGGYFDDLWVFDTHTRRSSIVWERGDWASPGTPALALQGETLYLLGPGVYAIALRDLAELIDDDEIRGAFCEALGIPQVPKYALPPPESRASGMWKIGMRGDTHCWDTLQHKGRVFHFPWSYEGLMISEFVFFGQRAKEITVRCQTGMKSVFAGCCSFGDQILVFGHRRAGGEHFVALVSVDEGRFCEEHVHVNLLEIDQKHQIGHPFLCQMSENRVLMTCERCWNVLCCEVREGKVTIEEVDTKDLSKCPMPNALPLRLPDGNLLVAGSLPDTNLVIQVTPGSPPSFTKAGRVPKLPANRDTLVLVKDRFVIGFGGPQRPVAYGSRRTPSKDPEDLWVLDLETHKASDVKRKGKLRFGGTRPAVAILGGVCYVMEASISAIPLESIARLVESAEIREAFLQALGLEVETTGHGSAGDGN